MAKRSKKQAALMEAAEEYTPLEEYDLPGPVKAQSSESETQPVAADCDSSEADASFLEQSQYTTKVASCQAPDDTTEADAKAIADKPADETADDTAATDGTTTTTSDAPTAQEAEAGLLTLAEIQARVAEIAAEKARTLIADLHSARSELAHTEAKHDAAVADAEQAVARLSERVDETCRAAAQMVDQAISVLGDDAQEMLDQIQAAEEAELAVVQSELGGAEAQAQAVRESREAALTEAQARVQNLTAELEALVAASPAAERIAAEAREVGTLVAEAETFIEDATRDAQALENLVGRLAPYTRDHVPAAEAIVTLRAYADAWYADQLYAEIAALEPGPRFEEQLAAVVARAEATGVEHLVQDAVHVARERDRRALAEKGREARLFARGLAETGNVQPGDVVAHRAGRVTVYRPLNGKGNIGNGKRNGKYRIALVYLLRDDGWEQQIKPVGTIISRIRDRRRIVVQ
ncbi:MAG: hypothetical protein SXV54_19340 [Chloroflexota bacterium]|nr:hypothetical protein [Chloroflexota bacterium]